MRAPNHQAIKARCEASLPDLFTAHGWPVPTDVVRDQAGWVNPCFFVDHGWVVRFNARDPQLPKFRRERDAYALLHPHGFPVPNVRAFDPSCEHAPYAVLVAERLPGQNLEANWSTHTDRQRTALAYDAGQWLARMHNTTQGAYASFGETWGEGPFQAPSWSMYQERLVAFYLQHLRNHNMLDQSQCSQIEALIVGAKAIFDQVEVPSLVHNDYHFGNLLFVDDRITGIIDFEWSCAGDPVLDLHNLTSLERTNPGSREALLEGYQQVRSLPTDWRVRAQWYRVIGTLEMAWVGARFFNAETRQSL